MSSKKFDWKQWIIAESKHKTHWSQWCSVQAIVSSHVRDKTISKSNQNIPQLTTQHAEVTTDDTNLQ
jgi:hypothetical protein